MRRLGCVMALMLSTALAGASDRKIEASIVVDTPRADCWAAWTTSEGAKLVAPPAAKIELTLGGMYEWYFLPDAPAGTRGSEGAKVLAYLPNEWLAFSWNAPPSIPTLREAKKMTQVFVRFHELSPTQTRVEIRHPVPEEGPDWDKYFAYFRGAWPNVLKNMKANLEKPGRPAITPPTTGRSTIQEYALDHPAAKVWSAVSDPAQAKKWMAPRVEMDLRPGGAMRTNYDVNAAADADSWIVREVLAVDPGRVVAVKMVTAPAQFPFKKSIEGTWTMIFVDSLPNDRTKLRITGAGFRDDDETKTMIEYFDKANPQVIEKLKKTLAGE